MHFDKEAVLTCGVLLFRVQHHISPGHDPYSYMQLLISLTLLMQEFWANNNNKTQTNRTKRS